MANPSQETTNKAARDAIRAILAGTMPQAGDHGGWRPTIMRLSSALAEGLERAQALYQILSQSDKRLAALMAPADTLGSAGDTSAEDCPPLPAEARIDPALGAGACQWLDHYIAWSRKWAPEAFDDFHEGVGLFILSTLAARRVRISFGAGGKYTPLNIALVAHTTLYTKSSAAKLAREVLHAIGLATILGPEQTTPQKMLSDMAGKIVPADYGKLSPEDQDYVRRRAMFAAQRGWYYEEFGTHVKAMMQEAGPMAPFHGLLRLMDDCPEEYTSSGVTRGDDHIKKPYLTLLASMTPADLKKGAKQGAEMWNDGLWARFSFITPPEGAIKEGRYPEEEYTIPAAITEPLKAWHEWLGVPEVDIKQATDEEGDPTGKYRATVGPLPERICDLGPGVIDAFYNYRYGLRRLASEMPDHDLYGNYGRFPEKALRMAALFASLENGGAIEMRHWARAQAITEHMRASLHRMIEQANEAAPSKAAREASKIERTINRLGQATVRDVARMLHISPAEARPALTALESAGVLISAKEGKKEVYRLAPVPEIATGAG